MSGGSFLESFALNVAFPDTYSGDPVDGGVCFRTRSLQVYRDGPRHPGFDTKQVCRKGPRPQRALGLWLPGYLSSFLCRLLI